MRTVFLLATTLTLTALTTTSFAQTTTYAGSLRVRKEGWDGFKPAGSFQPIFTGSRLIEPPTAGTPPEGRFSLPEALG